MKICSLETLVGALSIDELSIGNVPQIVYPVQSTMNVVGDFMNMRSPTIESRYVTTHYCDPYAPAEFFHTESMNLLRGVKFYKTLDNELTYDDLSYFRMEMRKKGSFDGEVKCVQIAANEFVVLDIRHMRLFRSGNMGAVAYVSNDPMLRFSFVPGESSNNALVEWEFGDSRYRQSGPYGNGSGLSSEGRGSSAHASGLDSMAITINGVAAELRPRAGLSETYVSSRGPRWWDL